MTQVSRSILKSDPYRTRQLYDDAGLKRQRLARLQMAHRLQATRLSNQAPLNKAEKAAEDRATKLEINPPNRSQIEREEKARVAKTRQMEQNAKWLEFKRLRMKEQKLRIEREVQAEANMLQQKRMASEAAWQENRRKAILAAHVAAEKKKKNDQIIAMKNEIKALSSEPIAANLQAPVRLPISPAAVSSNPSEDGDEDHGHSIFFEEKHQHQHGDEDADEDEDEDTYGNDDWDDEETRNIIAGNMPQPQRSGKQQSWDFDFSDNEDDEQSSSSYSESWEREQP
jgi:hypothetical protein